jgi:tRNA dimethylallyltransferase
MNGRELLIAGPTAVGKTEVALELAERLNGEIISVDSMQVYRGLDIGTAKPTPGERARVPHHLIDILDPTQTFDAAQFLSHARQAVDEIRSRNRLPIFCGGTGLYFKAWLEGIGQSPAPDPGMRAELQQLPPEQLLAELRERDPETFARIDRNNTRRVIRAVEVIRLTGKPFSQQRTRTTATAVPFFVLQRDRADLHRRIEARVEAMFARGLIDETKRASSNPAARQALGYRQVIEHLAGERSLEETVALVKLRTRQYAKRQLTWFRHQAQAEWIDARDAVDRIARLPLAQSH